MPNNVNLQSSRPMKLNQVGPVCEEKSLELGMKYGIVISLKKQLVISQNAIKYYMNELEEN